MAVTTTVEKITASMKLIAGTTSTGAQKIVSVSLGTLNKNTWDAQKALTLASTLEAFLLYPLQKLSKAETSSVSDE